MFATWSISIKLNDSLPSCYTKNDSISFQWSNFTQKTDATATLGQITRFQSSHFTILKHINLIFKWLVEQYNAAAFSCSSNMNGLHATRVNEKSLRSFFTLFTCLIKDGLSSLANLASQLAVASVSWGWRHLTNTGSHRWGTLSCWCPRGPNTKGHWREERRERPETEREGEQGTQEEFL